MPRNPLAISIRKQESWINLHEAEVLPLQKEQTALLITETLHSRIINSNAFTSAVFTKTGGNTFFIIQLLTALFEEGILIRNEEGDWEWNEKMLQESNVSDNVVDFLEKKITALEPQLQQLLLTASCLGDVFDLKTLVLLHQKKMNVVANKLSEIINSGYLIALDDYLDGYFKTAADTANDEIRFLNIPRFRFAHDRIRQTALSMLPEEKKAQLNLQAARIKLSNLPAEEIEQEIFYIANHFNAGKNLISSNEELQQLALYNLQAGIKAKNASAFDAAIRYFNTAKPHFSINNDYTQLYQLQLQLAECLYLTGNYAEAESGLDDLYNICKTRIDKLNTLFVKVYLYNIQDKKLEAVDAGKKGYGLYNIYMPRNKMLVMLLLLKEIFVTSIKVPEKKIEALLRRPLIKDPEQIRFQEFLLAMSPTLYQYDQNVFAWNFMRMMSASLRFGNNGISSFSYIGYGMLVSQLFGKYRMGKKLADVAIQLNNQLGYTALKWKVRLSYYNFVHHWTEPIRPELDNILEVENGAYANGDPIFAGYAIFIFHQKKFALGFQLKELQTSFESYLRVVEQRHDVETHHFLESYYYAIRCLRGLETSTAVMGAAFDAPVRLRQYTDASSFTVVADTFIAYMSTLFLFGYTEEAYRRYTEAIKYMDFIQQRYEFAEFNFYSVLICAAAHEKKLQVKPPAAAQIKKHLKKLKTWKEHCAANFEPQYLLATAEQERISGNGQRVAALYEQAIESAARYQFINYKAIACEQAGRYQFNNGNKIIAKTYLDNARKAYQQWGAMAKVLQLENEFSELLGNTILEKEKLQENNSSLTAGFDVNTLLQATQAVKSEKDVDKLVEQLMKTIIQYSGADTGYLLVKSKADLVVKAKYSNAAGVQAVTEYADNEMMPMSIVKYVIRLKEPHILNNPAAIAEYSNTRYFEKNKPRALICYPVLKQGEIFGVLYLENYATEAVFDEQKINMLSLIAAQAAVALDNAYLYENMESRILERTEAIEAEKGIVDEMLQNILPKAAIEELKLTGKTTAQKFDDVTVLLADIKGFTKISEKLTPEELIAKIDFYFRSFDDIMVKYGLEKIKTIGDAYMAAGGLAGDAANGAVNMVKAAFEMQQCIMDENKDVVAAEKLEMRIGIHTGTVIAGVVGVKKYQYDMWGDTVNIAARMEQESEPGRINVSKQTVALTNGTVAYTYRGKIDAKNKGPMDMFFADEMVQSTAAP